jgi:hypothetical protein
MRPEPHPFPDPLLIFSGVSHLVVSLDKLTGDVILELFLKPATMLKKVAGED